MWVGMITLRGLSIFNVGSYDIISISSNDFVWFCMQMIVIFLSSFFIYLAEYVRTFAFGDTVVFFVLCRNFKTPFFGCCNPEECLSLWKERYSPYRGEMTEALKPGHESKKDDAQGVIEKYKQVIYVYIILDPCLVVHREWSKNR